MTLFIGILEEGLIYAIMALGVYITYKILDFPDLSVDSTFPMGAALTASAILAGINPVLTLFLAFGAGALAGCVTGLIHVKLKVRDLLSGIIVMTGLYSLNLRMAGGRANVPIFSQETIFENGFLESVVPQNLTPYTAVVILAVITLVCKVLLDLYLKTRSGYLLRAVGDNENSSHFLSKGQRNGQDRWSGYRQWLCGAGWLYLLPAQRVFRDFRRNRYHGHRSCQCHHRNPVIEAVFIYQIDYSCHRRFHRL